MRHWRIALTAIAALTVIAQAQAADKPHNLILFVPDGMRAKMVTPETAPTMAAIRDQGVNFQNSHSMFPTFTMPNASAMATGHWLGDTGVFSNVIYTGYNVAAGNAGVTPTLENDAVLGSVDQHNGGNFLDETALLSAARRAGLSTAAIGKVGPILIFDHIDRAGAPTIVVDDATGSASGIPLAPEVSDALKQAALPLTAPSRGANGEAGTMAKPGTTVANVTQQNYFVDVATKVVLPMFKARNQSFVLVFWSRDPDGSQHNQGDSLGKITPGINGPTSLAAIKNADDDLARLRAALDQLGLAANTDIVVSADHGFTTISKESKTSEAAQAHYADVPEGLLPPGFLALDLAAATGSPLLDPSDSDAPIAAGHHPKAGSAIIGKNPAHPDFVVAANGGSDLVYIPSGNRQLAERAIAALLKEDYISGLFVDDRFGKIPGTLPLSAIGLHGNAVTPVPAIVVNFRSYTSGCAIPTNCTVEIADTPLQQGQGQHGSFSRGETLNFMAAIGPDFKAGFADPAPVSNADIGKTLAHVLGLNVAAKGKLQGRVISEAMQGGTLPKVTSGVLHGPAAADGLATVLTYQEAQGTRYFDAAGFPGRTFGLYLPTAATKTASASH
ncbi:MAG TPA: nucleotide pyrophosphatase/phosphodiesterase family protein [Stellaceae bacterium]|nr:nucleotide pyrophosphatase/phosphodiesterase family protein [Stellaceae bacterium]